MDIKKVKEAIKFLECKIKNQGIIQNERDINHLNNLKSILKELNEGLK
jgi:hypothetical protein